MDFSSGDSTRLAGVLAGPSGAETAVLLAHGITADREEEGVFTRLASHLAEADIASLRFDFRGHGASGGEPAAMTAAGETLDLAAARDELIRRVSPGRIGVIAASFGTVATARLVSRDRAAFSFLVLLNPVLDMRRTFTRPELPWARASFTPEALAQLPETGRIIIDDHFPAGADLIREMETGPQPHELLRQVEDMALLVIHGTDDTYVSYGIAREFAEAHPAARFVTVEGADHGFLRDHETRQVCEAVTTWLDTDRPPERPDRSGTQH